MQIRHLLLQHQSSMGSAFSPKIGMWCSVAPFSSASTLGLSSMRLPAAALPFAGERRSAAMVEVGDPGLAPTVRRIHDPNGSRLGTHHDRVGVRPSAKVPNPPKEIPVGDARGCEEHLFSAAEVLDEEDLPDVVAELHGPLPLRLCPRREPPLHGASHALERGGCDDALGGSADAHEDVHRCARAGHLDRGRHVPVADELDPRSRLADLPDEVLVARSVKDHDGHLAQRLPLGLGHREEVPFDAVVEADRVRQHLWANGNLVHVDAGPGVEQSSLLCDGNYRDGALSSGSSQSGPVQRVDCNIDLREAAVADALSAI
mmetsp:Transcript_30094/g.71690  ORF Transcript_30094/g.71690 Transcript_30094/m.71690 type:complete len:317 (-) Transcript_30094:637-1587(-)